VNLDDDHIEMLRQVYPEQMGRDPSGRLANMTHRAVKASVDKPAQIHYLHDDKCGGLVAIAGVYERMALFAARMQRLEPAPDGWRAVELSPGLGLGTGLGACTRGEDDFTAYQYLPIPPGAKPMKNGRGWTYPDGQIWLVIEPLGFSPPPPSFALRCKKCDRLGELARTRVVEDLKSYRGPRQRVPVSL